MMNKKKRNHYWRQGKKNKSRKRNKNSQYLKENDESSDLNINIRECEIEELKHSKKILQQTVRRQNITNMNMKEELKSQKIKGDNELKSMSEKYENEKKEKLDVINEMRILREKVNKLMISQQDKDEMIMYLESKVNELEDKVNGSIDHDDAWGYELLDNTIDGIK